MFTPAHFHHLTRAAAVAATLALAAAPAPLAAASQDGSFSVDGVGARPCGDFAKAVQDNNQPLVIAYTGWTEGFVSAFNAFRDDTFDLTPWQTAPVIMQKMLKFCTANPDTQYLDGLAKLSAVLNSQRMTEKSEIVQTQYDGQSAPLPAEVLSRVREVLAQTGAEVGTPEGEFGPEFADALLDYQKANSLPETGVPDQITLNAMFP